jgi:DNA-binding XRE family transcriptional regulator
VYYIAAPETGLVKIGFANDPEKRLGKIRVDSPSLIVLLAFENGGKDKEAARHNQFAHLRARGEWFKLEADLVEHIACLPAYIASRKRHPAKFREGALGQIRGKLALTQAEFADALGIHQSTISRMERGELEIDKRTMIAAQALLDIHMGRAA